MTGGCTCQIGPVTVGAGWLALIAGPCLAESLELCLEVARSLAEMEPLLRRCLAVFEAVR